MILLNCDRLILQFGGYFRYFITSPQKKVLLRPLAPRVHVSQVSHAGPHFAMRQTTGALVCINLFPASLS